MRRVLKKCRLCGKIRRFSDEIQPSCDECGGGVRVEVELDDEGLEGSTPIMRWEIKP